MNLKIQIKVTNGDKIKKYMYHPKLITDLLAFRWCVWCTLATVKDFFLYR
jgi:hypothetical protein